MMFLTIVGEDGSIKTYGNNSLEVLIEAALEDLPVTGASYRLVSKKLILRIEVLTKDPYVATFTNLEKRRHSGVVLKVLEKLDLYGASDNETVID